MPAKILPLRTAPIVRNDVDAAADAATEGAGASASSAPDLRAAGPLYRLFCMRQSGEIERLFSFTAPDQAQAVAEAEQRRAKRRAELWCKSRRVKLFADS